VVGLAQPGRRRDAERAHEVLDVEPVAAAGAGALLLCSHISSSGIEASWSRVETRPWSVPITASKVVSSSVIAAPVFLPS
jgi:hypothetical protein